MVDEMHNMIYNIDDSLSGFGKIDSEFGDFLVRKAIEKGELAEVPFGDAAKMEDYNFIVLDWVEQNFGASISKMKYAHISTDTVDMVKLSTSDTSHYKTPEEIIEFLTHRQINLKDNVIDFVKESAAQATQHIQAVRAQG
jgi:hypothetical protein